MEKQIIGRDVSSRWSLTVPVEGASNLLEFRLKLNVHLNEWVSVIASVDMCELKSAAAAAESLQSCPTLCDPMMQRVDSLEKTQIMGKIEGRRSG